MFSPRWPSLCLLPFSGGSVEEAYLILGLSPGIRRDDVFAAYRNLIKRLHSDQGGTSYLASRVNEAKDVLLKHVWGYRAAVYTRTVDMRIANLRQQLEDDPKQPRFILTVQGLGYKFKPEESEV